MTFEEMVRRFPQCRPTLPVGGWALFVFDERWRLPYRWYELRKYPSGKGGGGFAVMLAGCAVMVTRLGRVRRESA